MTPETQSIERRMRLLQAANEVGKQVTQILDLNELLPKTVDIICDAYGFYYAGVFLIDESGQWVVLRAGRGEAGRQMVANGHKLEIGGHSMIGTCTRERKARIALDVGDEPVHFKNPYLPHTRSEMALPLVVGEKVLGAVTVQSVEERAFSDEDIITLQTMADHLAVAIHNAQTLQALQRANAELLRTKTYEALTASTTQAIHWIGNKVLPITTTVARMKAELNNDSFDRQSLLEDLWLIEESARLILEVKENLLGPAREHKPRPAMLADVIQAAAVHRGLPAGKLFIQEIPGTPLAWADTTQLVRAFGNLLCNAIEAKARNITAVIQPAADADYVSVEIIDNGEGMPAEILEKAWAAFVTTKGPGHPGLGLPAALHVITQLHGRISVTSQPGQGTIFHILLPASHDQPAELSGGAKTILLVDDDDSWAQATSRMLTAAGKEVTRSLELKGAPDLILVDEALQAAPAAEVIAKLAAAGVAVKTLVITAALNVERTTAYLKAGVKDVLLKPYTQTELAELLRK